jgi:hypothetical protein
MPRTDNNNIYDKNDSDATNIGEVPLPTIQTSLGFDLLIKMIIESRSLLFSLV